MNITGRHLAAVAAIAVPLAGGLIALYAERSAELAALRKSATRDYEFLQYLVGRIDGLEARIRSLEIAAAQQVVLDQARRDRETAVLPPGPLPPR